MNIQTKLDYHQVAYFLFDNKALSGRVTKIDVDVEGNGPRDTNPKPRIEYVIDDRWTRKESEVFASKEDLRKSL